MSSGAHEVVLVAGADGRPTPVVCSRAGEPLDPHRWASAVRDQPPLAPPQQWRWEDLPKTATWKVRRLALADLLAECEAAGPEHRETEPASHHSIR